MLNIRVKSNQSKAISGLIASALLGFLPAAFGNYTESFESGDLSGWSAGTLNGSVSAVDAVRASDGIYSVGNSFAVSSGFAGWTMNTIIERDPRTFMNAGATTLTVDVYSDWANPAGWGVYGNAINLLLNYEGGWIPFGPMSGSLVNGSFATLTFDLTPHAATITNPGLAYSSIGIAWFVGTYDDNNGGNGYLASGTQTFAVDNIVVTQPVPEPGMAALMGLGLSALVAFRRRRA
jgi:hypothetical protein